MGIKQVLQLANENEYFDEIYFDEVYFDEIYFDEIYFDDVEIEPLESYDFASSDWQEVLSELTELDEQEFRKRSQRLEKAITKPLDDSCLTVTETAEFSELQQMLAELAELDEQEFRKRSQRLEKAITRPLIGSSLPATENAEFSDWQQMLAELAELDERELRRMTQPLEKPVTSPLNVAQLPALESAEFDPAIPAANYCPIDRKVTKPLVKLEISRQTTKLTELDPDLDSNSHSDDCLPAQNIVCPNCNLINALSNKRCRRCSKSLRKGGKGLQLIKNLPASLSVGKVSAIVTVALGLIVTGYALQPRTPEKRSIKLVYPADQMVVEQSVIKLQWQGRDEIYQIQIERDGKKVMERVTPKTQYYFTAKERALLKPGREYKWRVIPKKLNGQVLPYKTEEFKFFVIAR